MKKLYLALFLGLLAFGLAACGTSAEEKKEENKGKSAAGNAAEDTGESEVNDSTIRVAMKSEVDSLDPYKSSATDADIMLSNIFDGLFDTDENGELIPNLAQEYSISDDNLTYTFKLTENVTFHNGAKFTAEDVVYSYSRLAGLESGEPMSDKWAVVESVEATGDYEVEVKLKNVDSGFIARTITAILPAGYEEQDTHPIGAGPFKFVEHQAGQALVLERNEDYYLTDKIPQAKTVEFVLMPDTQTAVLAMQAGEMDIIPGVDEQALLQLGDGVSTISGPQNMQVMFGLNHKVEPLNNYDVRKAINLAINKEEIIQTAMQGRATRIDSNFSPAMSFFYESGVEGFYEHDIEAAKKALADAGYPEGFDLKLTVPTHATMYTDTAQILVDQLKKVNINVTLEPIEWSTWLEKVYDNFDHESTLIAFTGKLDPYDILIRFVDGYSRNFINYNNPEFDEVIEKAILETDENKRAEHYKRAQTILAEDAASVFLMDPDSTTVMREGVTGLKLFPLSKLNLEDLVITK